VKGCIIQLDNYSSLSKRVAGTCIKHVQNYVCVGGIGRLLCCVLLSLQRSIYCNVKHFLAYLDLCAVL